MKFYNTTAIGIIRMALLCVCVCMCVCVCAEGSFFLIIWTVACPLFLNRR